MHIPLLHIWRQLCLGPFLCHCLVILVHIVSQPLLNLTASSIVVAEVLKGSWHIFWQLDCQYVYFLVAHDSQDIKVWPLSQVKSSLLWCPFSFAIEMLASKLEEHIRSTWFSWEYTYACNLPSIELKIFSPGILDLVSSLFNYFLLMICVGSLELCDLLFQHAYMVVSQPNFWARYTLCL